MIDPVKGYSPLTAFHRVVLGLADAIARAVLRLEVCLHDMPRWRYAMTLLVVSAAFGADRADAALVRQLDADGRLIGASGVVVDGLSYDVRFQTGTCIAVFSGCTPGSLGPFLSEFEARQATAVLLADVFVDVPEGAFDTDPALSCDPFGRLCRMFTPFAILDDGLIHSAVAYNSAFEGGDVNAVNRILTPDVSLGASVQGSNSWAVWTRQGAAVPEPGTLSLLAATGLALAWTQRRRARATMGQQLRLKQQIRPAAGS